VLGWLAVTQNDFTAGRAALEESIALWRTLRDVEELALALCMFAYSSVDGADPRAIAAADEAVALAGEAGSPFASAFSFNAVGQLALRRQDWPAARAALEEAIAIAGGEGAAAPRASFVMGAAAVDSLAGDLDRAAVRYREALILFRGLGSHTPRWLIAMALTLAGELACRRRDPDEAILAFREALQLSQQVGALGVVLRSIAGLGRVAVMLHDWRRAAELFGAVAGLNAAYQLGTTAGTAQAVREQHLVEQLLGEVRTALGETAFTTAWEQGRMRSLEEAIAFALEEGTSA
jgi:tetratricopeptide (TPR) repeat protein